MARILFAWELGGGMGHLVSLRPIIRGLVDQGYAVTVAARDVGLARRLIGDDVTCLQAPLWRVPTDASNRVEVRTYAHILHNVGYREPAWLADRLRSWRALFDYVKPDVLVCDSSPTALLAARGRSMRTVIMGTGFHIPPAVYPLPAMRFMDQIDDVDIAHEHRLTAAINSILDAFDIPRLGFLGELFSSELTMVTGVKELDHYDGRTAPIYTGPFTQLPGDTPDWPVAGGLKVFAYLKPFPRLTELLDELKRREAAALIYGPAIDSNIRACYAEATIRFCSKPVDMTYAATGAELMISHAGYGFPFDALLVGKPLLSFPLFLDQYITAQSLEVMGVGNYYSPMVNKEVIRSVFDKASSSSCAYVAQCFRSTYGYLDRQAETESTMKRIFGRCL